LASVCRRRLSVLSSPDPAPTELYTLSLHDALPICWLDEAAYADLVALCQFLPGPASSQVGFALGLSRGGLLGGLLAWAAFTLPRSEEHTSELQSRENLVCRLLLEKKNSSPGGVLAT